MARALFVYWKLDPAGLPAALAAVKAAQQRLREGWPGLQAQVWLRCDAAAGAMATVMETYAAPDGIDAAGERRIDAALAGIAPGTRHVEAFTPG